MWTLLARTDTYLSWSRSAQRLKAEKIDSGMYTSALNTAGAWEPGRGAEGEEGEEGSGGEVGGGGVKTLTSLLRDFRISPTPPDTAEFTTAEKSWGGGTQHSQSQTLRRNDGNVFKTLAQARSNFANQHLSARAHSSCLAEVTFEAPSGNELVGSLEARARRFLIGNRPAAVCQS